MHGVQLGSTIASDTPNRRDARRHLRLLITSAGRRVALLQAFRAGAEELGIDLDVVACDLQPELSAACQIADDRFAAPPATEPGYVDKLLDECRRREIHLLVPTIDPELLPLAQAVTRFEEAGTSLAISDPSLVAMARDKLATSEFFAANGIATPATWPLDTIREGGSDWPWPLMIKPRHGSASRSIGIAERAGDLPLSDEEPMIAQELLSGDEWTVNLYFDKIGALRASVPHRRIRVRAGEVEKGITKRLDVLESISAKLAACLPGPRGAMCYQAMIGPGGQASVFEINARFGGGFPLANHAGARFAKWLLEERAGLPCSADEGWMEGITMLRYDAAVFVHP